MAITINGTGTITGLSVDGLPAGTVNTATLASNSVTTVDIVPASVIPSKLSQPLTAMTSQTASSTAVDFTSIPSWVKRITIMFNGVSTSGTNSIQVQLGTSAGFDTASGYVSSANSTAFSSTGLLATNAAVAANNYSGVMILTYLGGNIWVSSCITTRNDAFTFSCAGAKTLSGVLDRIRFTTYAAGGTGTDTFDAGSINVMYE
jgi:hypothetical protein